MTEYRVKFTFEYFVDEKDRETAVWRGVVGLLRELSYAMDRSIRWNSSLENELEFFMEVEVEEVREND